MIQLVILKDMFYKGGYISQESQEYLTGSGSYSSSGSSSGASGDSGESSSGVSSDSGESSSSKSGSDSQLFGQSSSEATDGSGKSSSYSQSGSSPSNASSISYPIDMNYEDYQKDYETDMRDSEGNPIMLSIVSTSGGQMEAGIYQVYWSSAGPINQTRIG